MSSGPRRRHPLAGAIALACAGAALPAMSLGCVRGDDFSVPPLPPDVSTDGSPDGSTDARSDSAAETTPDVVADSASDAAETTGDATDGESASDADVATGDVATDGDETADVLVPYRHTIVIDGTNDFIAASEKLTTTSTGYDAYVTWDAAAIYVGYSGADLGPSSTDKRWLFVYFDGDPGGSTGSTTAEKYNTQAAKFPVGFGADAYFAFRADGLFAQWKKYVAGAWTTVTVSGITTARSGSYVEFRIPLALVTVSTKVGAITFMLNEASAEWTYAGLYAGSFTDGYDPAKAIGNWLSADFSSGSAPNAAGNKRP